MSWNDWTWNDDYSRAYLPTSDPRVLAVIERDTDAIAPDGDAYAPALIVYGWGNEHLRRATETSVREPVDAGILADAMFHFGDHVSELGSGDTLTERYLRIFHDTHVATVSSTIDRYSNVVILDTPAHREAMGTPATFPTEDYLRGDVEAWQAYLDGDVYGIGYAVNEARVLDDGEPIDLDEWDVTIECWGLYGDDCAMSEAVDFPYGGPRLDPLIPFDIAS